MKTALLWLAVAACEFTPAPPPAPPPPTSAQPPAPVAPRDASPAPDDAALAPVVVLPRPDAAVIAVTDDCVRTSTHIAEVLIASAPDASLKANYEQARDRIVRTTAEACTTQSWTADAQRCFAQAKLEVDLHACETKFPPSAPPKH